MDILQSQIALSEKLNYGMSDIRWEFFSITQAWIVEVCQVSKFVESHTSHLSQVIWNNYAVARKSQKREYDKAEYQLYASASIYIASVLSELFPIDDDNLVEYSAGAFNKEQLYNAIADVCATLSGKLLIPTPYHLLEILSFIYPEEIEKTELDMTNLILLVIQTKPEIYNFPFIELAVGVLFYSKIFIGAEPADLEIFDYKYGDVKDLIYQINIIANNVTNYDYYDQIIPKEEWQTMLDKMNSLVKDYSIPSSRKDFSVPDIPNKSPVNLENVEIPEGQIKIGEGTYGTVYKLTDQDVAVKEQLKEKHYNESIKEIALMRTLSHPNIEKVLGFSFTNPEYVYIKLPFKKGTLRDAIKEGLTKKMKRKYAKDLLSGLAFLHENGIIHGDIKPNNILISDQGALTIIDFGGMSAFNSSMYNFKLRKWIGTYQYLDVNVLEKVVKREQRETRAYQADSVPIIELLDEYSFEVDVWSAAVVIIEMEKDGFPFNPPDTNKEMLKSVKKYFANGKAYKNFKDVNLRSLLQQMLLRDKITRITAKQALIKL